MSFCGMQKDPMKKSEMANDKTNQVIGFLNRRPFFFFLAMKKTITDRLLITVRQPKMTKTIGNHPSNEILLKLDAVEFISDNITILCSFFISIQFGAVQLYYCLSFFKLMVLLMDAQRVNDDHCWLAVNRESIL
jgi:hypothetical protein